MDEPKIDEKELHIVTKCEENRWEVEIDHPRYKRQVLKSVGPAMNIDHSRKLALEFSLWALKYYGI